MNYLILGINLLSCVSLPFLCLITDFKIFCLLTDWLFYGLLYCHLCPHWNHVHQLLRCSGRIQWDHTLQEEWLGLGTWLLWQQILLLKQLQTLGCSWAWFRFLHVNIYYSWVYFGPFILHLLLQCCLLQCFNRCCEHCKCGSLFTFVHFNFLNMFSLPHVSKQEQKKKGKSSSY